MDFFQKTQKRPNRNGVRLSLNVFFKYGTYVTSVPVRAVVHEKTPLKSPLNKRNVYGSIAYLEKKVKQKINYSPFINKQRRAIAKIRLTMGVVNDKINTLCAKAGKGAENDGMLFHRTQTN